MLSGADCETALPRAWLGQAQRAMRWEGGKLGEGGRVSCGCGRCSAWMIRVALQTTTGAGRSRVGLFGATALGLERALGWRASCADG